MAVNPKATVETHVIITEGADMAFDVKYKDLIAGTEERAHMRPSHLVGQLICAAFFVMVQNFDNIRAEMAPVETDGKKSKSK